METHAELKVAYPLLAELLSTFVGGNDDAVNSDLDLTTRLLTGETLEESEWESES